MSIPLAQVFSNPIDFNEKMSGKTAAQNKRSRKQPERFYRKAMLHPDQRHCRRSGNQPGLAELLFQEQRRSCSEEIMMERMQQMFGTILPILMDKRVRLRTRLIYCQSITLICFRKIRISPIFHIERIKGAPGHIQQSIPVALYWKALNSFNR